MFDLTPQPGDWIRTRKRIKVTMTDFALGCDGGIPTGTRGVVLNTSGWGRLTVRLHTGWGGTRDVQLRAREVRIVRRGGGEAALRESVSRLGAVRFGVALAFAAPFAWFAVSWFVVHHGSQGGFLMAILSSAVSGAIDLIGYAIAQPIRALVYLAIVTIAWRFAFR